MSKFRSTASLVLMAAFLLVCMPGVSCVHVQDFDSQLSEITRPFKFNIAKWEFGAIFEEVKEIIRGNNKNTDDEAGRVVEYFSSVERIKSLKLEIEAISSGGKQGNVGALEAELSRLQQQNLASVDMVEKIIEGQIRDALSQQGIFNPLYKYLGLKVGFPPLNFVLGEPPRVLVISPKDRIESIREITLQPGISAEDMGNIEAGADKLGVSSLVVGLGGFAGTYPSFVVSDANLRFIIDTAAEEWLHQYLVFKPLGFRYLLDVTGLSRNYDIATMNETVASIVSKEVGAIVYEKHYAQNGVEYQAADQGFDFNREMREIRKTVDEYLAGGEIERAEEFMEQKRQYIVSKGYYIRKLNQAYFAFHGTYADSPTSISPIGTELNELRSQSGSLKDFLETVAALTSRQDLIDIIR